MNDEQVRVGIVDDHDLFREGIVALLGRDGRVRVVGAANDSASALELVDAKRPDVLLLDVSIPGAPARVTIARIRRRVPQTRVVVLTMHQDALLRADLLAAGASAYLTKTAPSAELVTTILAAVRAELPASADDGNSGTSILSAREQQVLALVAQALSNREIAETLGIAEGTVKRHTTSIYAKLTATSRIDAVRKATRLGILTTQTNPI